MTATTQQGITVMPVLFDPPAALTTAPQVNPLRGNYPPQDLGAIGDFGAKLAARYGPSGSFWKNNPSVPKLPITAWQIWNEPNFPSWWGGTPSASGYAQMLTTVAPMIRAADPSAEIVSAGMPDSLSTGAIRLGDYVTQLYAAGAKGSFDTLAVNGYAPTGKEVVKLITHIRSVMNKYGGSREALRVTEFGWADWGPEPKIELLGGRQEAGGLHVAGDPGPLGRLASSSTCAASSTTPGATSRSTPAARTSGACTPACSR